MREREKIGSVVGGEEEGGAILTYEAGILTT